MRTMSFPQSADQSVLTAASAGERTGLAQGLKVFQVLAGGPWGGGAVVVLSLTKRLLQEGCQVWVLCLSDEVCRRFSEAGARVVTLCWRREINPLLDLVAFWKLFRLCRRERFDLVHTHTSKGGFLGRIAARLAGVPVIVHTVHGFAFHEFTGSVRTIVYTYLERFAAQFCDLLICVNNEDRRTAIERGIVEPAKIVTILNGIDLAPFTGETATDALRKELGIPEQATIVGTVGRLAPQKGFADLVAAVPEILCEQPDTWFVFAGNGPQREELEGQAEALGISERCRFLGFRHDIPRLLACYDIFVLPSLWEGLSITLLEAMAASKPVVVTDIKGNREVVHDGVNGLLCQPYNGSALAEAITRLIEHPELAATLGKGARHTIEQCFDKQAMLAQTVDIYRTLTSTQIRSMGREYGMNPPKGA